MGLSWTLEIIAWIIIEGKATIPNQFTFILLSANVCQGIVVFLVFGLKRTNRLIMKSKVSQFWLTLTSAGLVTTYTVTNQRSEIGPLSQQHTVSVTHHDYEMNSMNK